MNALKSCKGLITRNRNRQGQIQKSIFDFYVVCKRLLPHVTEMVIDSKGEYTITNYAGAKHGRRAMDSDHVTMILKMNLNVLPQKPQRVELFDFQNKVGQKLFKKITSETKEFTDCFQNMLPLLEQCELWHETLKSYCARSYQIIRIRIKSNKPFFS